MKTLSNIFLWTHHTDLWCNMLQTLQRRRKQIGIILQIAEFYFRLRNFQIKLVER